jgi:formylglycine-generating enzyme required for sulfatase activity
MGETIMTELANTTSQSYQLSPEQMRDAELAVQRINVFERRYGADVLKLACHAAFPMALTSELVYCLRENFDDLQNVPWVAAADVLLSGLCQPIGNDLYEMHAAVRIELLKRLREQFGDLRVLDLEALMGDYILTQLNLEAETAEAQERSSRERSRILGDRSRWTTLCCLRPGIVRQTIEQEVRRIWTAGEASERERLHLSAMLESYGALLPGEPILLEWAEQVEMGEAPTSSWDNWAAELGITLVSKAVRVSRIRFEGEVVEPEGEVDPNALRRFEFDVVTVDERGDEASRETQAASYFFEPLGVGVPPLELVAIPGGRFEMGSPKQEKERSNDEGPQHWVDVPPFFMGKYLITQVQWRFVAEQLPQIQRKLTPAPSRFEGDDRPVEQVSWLDVQEFCARVSQMAGRTCRLPTEAEWEYACRAGTTTPFHFGATISPQFANYDGNYTYDRGKKGQYQEETVAVGSFGVTNTFGLYDMHGNVRQWCEDHWHDNYEGAPKNGSAWIDLKAKENALRVLRGGSWLYDPMYCRSASRYWSAARFHNDDIGFRVVYSPVSTLLFVRADEFKDSSGVPGRVQPYSSDAPLHS